MQTTTIVLQTLNMPKDSQNICDELKSIMVCHAMDRITERGDITGNWQDKHYH
jgi:hypothetical protein